MPINTDLDGEILPTPKQRAAVDNILSGKYSSKAAAIKAAGYSNSHSPVSVLKQVGIQKYIKMLGIYSKQIYGKSIEKKVIEVYTEGLGATKLFGKNAKEHPDWIARKAFADKVGGMLGMGTADSVGNTNNQYNFFMYKPEEREEFNSAFSQFVRDYYKK